MGRCLDLRRLRRHRLQETLVDLLKRSHLDVTEGQLAFVLFYWPLAKISLDFVGYSLALGFLAFAALYCFGFCWCACCCGRSGMRRRAKRKADGQEPFIDLIENRSISWLANTLMFVITFALPSYVALAGTAMVGPDRVLARARERFALVPLCKGAALAALQRPAEAALGNPALAWLAVHSWWRSSLVPIHDLCFANGDAGLAPLTVASTGADVRAAEALWLAVRDANKLAVPNQEVVAQIANFTGSCGPNATAPTLLDDEGAPTKHLRAVRRRARCASFAVRRRLAPAAAREARASLRANGTAGASSSRIVPNRRHGTLWARGRTTWRRRRRDRGGRRRRCDDDGADGVARPRWWRRRLPNTTNATCAAYIRVQRAQRRHRTPRSPPRGRRPSLSTSRSRPTAAATEAAASRRPRRSSGGGTLRLLARWQTAALAALDAPSGCARGARTRWRLTKLLFFNPTLRQYRKQALRDAAALLRQRITSVAERSIRSVKSGKGDRVDAAATTAGLLAVGSFLNAEV